MVMVISKYYKNQSIRQYCYWKVKWFNSLKKAVIQRQNKYKIIGSWENQMKQLVIEKMGVYTFNRLLTHFTKKLI